MTKSAKILSKVAEAGCVVCRKELDCESPALCHHLQEGMTGRKSPDEETIPLCSPHHDYWHEGSYHESPATFEAEHGTQRELLEWDQKDRSRPGICPVCTEPTNDIRFHIERKHIEFYREHENGSWYAAEAV